MTGFRSASATLFVLSCLGAGFIVRAQVTLAEAPSDTVLNEIKAALRDVAKADVSVDVRIDPSLIGGLIVKMGSRMVDASVRTKLNSIRLAMKEVH